MKKAERLQSKGLKKDKRVAEQKACRDGESVDQWGEGMCV